MYYLPYPKYYISLSTSKLTFTCRGFTIRNIPSSTLSAPTRSAKLPETHGTMINVIAGYKINDNLLVLLNVTVQATCHKLNNNVPKCWGYLLNIVLYE